MKKKETSKGYLSEIIIVSVIIVSILFLITICLLIFWVVNDWSSDDKAFCTSQDGVYQVFVENAQEWISLIGSSNELELLPSAQFRVEGSNYAVRIYSSPSVENEPLIFVSTKPGWSNSIEGSRGYFYSQTTEIKSDFWNENYNISYLDRNIFCYSK